MAGKLLAIGWYCRSNRSLALMRPALDVTCVDAVGKKAAFIRQAAGELGLPHLHAEHARVEQLKTTEPFDLITATDVLPYLGALEPLFFGAAENMVDGGIFVFSSETRSAATMDGKPYKVGPHQRFVRDHAMVLQPHDRLVENRDLLALQGAPPRLSVGQRMSSMRRAS